MIRGFIPFVEGICLEVHVMEQAALTITLRGHPVYNRDEMTFEVFWVTVVRAIYEYIDASIWK